MWLHPLHGPRARSARPYKGGRGASRMPRPTKGRAIRESPLPHPGHTNGNGLAIDIPVGHLLANGLTDDSAVGQYLI